MSRRVLAALTCAALSLPLSAGIAVAATPPPDSGHPLAVHRLAHLPAPTGATAKLGASIAKASGPVTAFVQLDAPSGVDTAEAGGGKAAVEAAATTVEQIAAEVVPDTTTSRVAAGTPTTVTVTSDLVAGIVVTGDAGRIRALAADPKVLGVHLMVPKKPLNRGTDAFTGALQAWQATGQTGEGVRIGIIDTGLDYTHADFGGPGTPEAYAQAYGTDGTVAPAAGLFDPEKYLGGWDFAGMSYDAGSSDPAALIPQPDPNPIDGVDGVSGHGSHVAGTAAGFGVTAEGQPFAGDYSTLTDLSGMKIGPGSAPEAGIYALKVFGDGEGSTDLTINALEWSADPNGDGDYSDHLDVINMSLGSDSSPADDPDNLFIDQLTKLGVVSVIASGNAGDITDVGGTPGNARSALTVANSVGNTQTVDAVDVTAAADPALLGLHAAQNTVAYGGADVTAPVVFLGAAVTGCSAFPADQAAAIAGKIVWLFWGDDARACGSVGRWNNATAAGAAGVLIGTADPVFSYGISGNASIPGAMLTAESTTTLLPEIAAGSLTMTIGPSFANASFIPVPAVADTLNSSSSRGVHGSLGIVKPDVAAPGTGISSASSGSGNDRSTKSGTSMATPHVAGIAALVAGEHPDWSAQQIKADVMNTATHDVSSGSNGTGPLYGPERIGSGRVDAFAATTNSVLAYAKDDPALVSVTFGVVPVGARTVVQRKTVTVANTGTSTQRFSTSFAQSTAAGGATISVSPSTLTIPAGRSREVTVTLRVDPATVAKQLDPTSVPSYDLGIPVPRDFVSSVSGRLVLTSTGGSTLRVPVQAAPRLVSEMAATPVTLAPGGTSAPLTLTGRGVDSGGWTSLVAPFDLVATSPKLDAAAAVGASPSVIASGDLRYVGFTSTAPQLVAAGADPATAGHGTIGIGIAVDGEWASLGTNTIPVIDTDVDGDGVPDLETLIWKYDAAMDFTTVETYEIVNSGGSLTLGNLLDLSPVNGLWGDVDTSVFDSNVVVAPINLDAVGIVAGDKPSFDVYTVSSYASDPSGVLDSVAPFTADPFAPTSWFDLGGPDSLWTQDAAGTPVTVHRQPGAGNGQLLLLHTHNAVGTRAQVVSVTAPAATATTTALQVTGDRTAGGQQTLRATITPRAVTGTVRFLDGATELGTAAVVRGTARLTVSLPVGEHSLTAELVPASAAFLPSTSAATRWTIADRAASTTSAFAPSVITSRSTSRVTVLVQSIARPTGTVTVSEGGTTLGTATLFPVWTTGVAVVNLPRLSVGAHHLTVSYDGSASVAGSSTTVDIRVVASGRY